MSEVIQEGVGILGFITDSIKGERTLQRFLAQAKEFCTIEKVSSVYKRDFDPAKERHVRNSELVMTAKVVTELAPKVFSLKVSNIRSLEAGASSQVSLLAINREILMTPGFTLPDPNLVQDRLLLQCAAEVWGDYEHPILSQTLTELVKLYPTRDTIEFFSQGTYLYSR